MATLRQALVKMTARFLRRHMPTEPPHYPGLITADLTRELLIEWLEQEESYWSAKARERPGLMSYQRVAAFYRERLETLRDEVNDEV